MLVSDLSGHQQWTSKMDVARLTAASPASLHDFSKLLWPPSSWTTKLKRSPRIPPAWICPLRFASESSVY